MTRRELFKAIGGGKDLPPVTKETMDEVAKRFAAETILESWLVSQGMQPPADKTAGIIPMAEDA